MPHSYMIGVEELHGSLKLQQVFDCSERISQSTFSLQLQLHDSTCINTTDYSTNFYYLLKTVATTPTTISREPGLQLWRRQQQQQTANSRRCQQQSAENQVCSCDDDDDNNKQPRTRSTVATTTTANNNNNNNNKQPRRPRWRQQQSDENEVYSRDDDNKQ